MASAGLLAALLLVSACGSSSPASPAGTGTGTAAKAGSPGECQKIRSEYPGLPSNVDIAISPYNPPSESTDPNNPGQMVGLEPDLVKAVASCLDFTYSYSSQSFANVIAALQSGRDALGITALYVTPARQKIIDFVPYRDSVDQVVMTKSESGKLHSPSDFCGLTSGVTTGSVELTYLQQVSAQCQKQGKKPIKINIYQDIGTIFLSESEGRLDFTLNAAELTGSALKQYPGKLAAGFLDHSLSFTVAIGVAKSQVKLGDAVAAAVTALQKSGEEAALLKKWGYPASTQIPATFSQ